MTYSVAIVTDKAEAAAPIVVLYKGVSYDAAFNAAVQARSIAEYRGKWIRLKDGYLGVTKWAQVL